MFFSQFRNSFGKRTHALCIGVCILAGLMGGMPITPEEIEKHMRCASAVKTVQVLEDKDRQASDLQSHLSCVSQEEAR